MEGISRLRWDSTSVHVLCSGTFLIASAGLMEIDLFVVYSVQLWRRLHGSCIRLKQICTETKILSFFLQSAVSGILLSKTLSSWNPPLGDFRLQLPCSVSRLLSHLVAALVPGRRTFWGMHAKPCEKKERCITSAPSSHYKQSCAENSLLRFCGTDFDMRFQSNVLADICQSITSFLPACLPSFSFLSCPQLA